MLDFSLRYYTNYEKLTGCSLFQVTVYTHTHMHVFAKLSFVLKINGGRYIHKSFIQRHRHMEERIINEKGLFNTYFS